MEIHDANKIRKCRMNQRGAIGILLSLDVRDRHAGAFCNNRPSVRGLWTASCRVPK